MAHTTAKCQELHLEWNWCCFGIFSPFLHFPGTFTLFLFFTLLESRCYIFLLFVPRYQNRQLISLFLLLLFMFTGVHHDFWLPSKLPASCKVWYHLCSCCKKMGWIIIHYLCFIDTWFSIHLGLVRLADSQPGSSAFLSHQFSTSQQYFSLITN
jgi:hypothetical protein